MTQQVKALALTGYGLNCDHETAFAFEQAGATAERVHINALISGAKTLDGFHVLAFVGGFSWGDDHGAGVIQAHRMKTRLGKDLVAFVERGGLVIGICNGFQTLVNLGLLPGIGGDYATRSVALIANDRGNFRDDWAALSVNPASPCVFTKGIEFLELPIRHGEGKFFCEPETLDALTVNNQIVMRYADDAGAPAKGRFPQNPNGSVDDIAGICDTTGRVFGLMPHPEAYNHPTNHPHWPLQKEKAVRSGKNPVFALPTDGIQLFLNGVAFVKTQVM